MRSRIAIVLALSVLGMISTPIAGAARFSRAELTRAINDVRILLSGGGSRGASAGTTVTKDNSVATGQKSRAELTFPDDTIIRLGQNTVFSFLDGRREVKLESGTLLVRQPKGRGRTEIRTAAVSAAITGSVVMLGTDDEAAKRGMEKLMVVEGGMKFNLIAAPRKSMALESGEMVFLPANATELPRKFVFDIAQAKKTAGLMGDDFGPMPGMDKVDEEINAQNADKRHARLLEVNLAHFPRKPGGALFGIFGRHDAQEVRNRKPLPPEPPRVIRRPPPPPRDDPPPPPPQDPPDNPNNPDNPPGPNDPPTGGPGPF